MMFKIKKSDSQKQGTWTFVKDFPHANMLYPVVFCLSCGGLISLQDHEINDDGIVVGKLKCQSNGGCGFKEEVMLKDWEPMTEPGECGED